MDSFTLNEEKDKNIKEEVELDIVLCTKQKR